VVTRCVVPKVRGKTLRAAKASISRANCRTGHVTRKSSRKVRKGRVLSQKPRPGTRLAPRSKVNLVVSRGRI
jgi:beta-lactam-binding protein with PASTA domain